MSIGNIRKTRQNGEEKYGSPRKGFCIEFLVCESILQQIFLYSSQISQKLELFQIFAEKHESGHRKISLRGVIFIK